MSRRWPRTRVTTWHDGGAVRLLAVPVTFGTIALMVLGLLAPSTLSAWARAEPGPAPGRRDSRTLWLRSLHRGDELRVAPFGEHGRLRRLPWAALTRFLRSRMGREPRRTVHPRLVRVLVQLQRRFGGRRLDVLSGYRAPEDGAGLTSYHQVGRAVDVAIRGVPDRELFEACRAVQGVGEGVGCGFYPRGRHVHVDVRSRDTIWVDLSGYGDGALYVADPAAWLAAHP